MKAIQRPYRDDADLRALKQFISEQRRHTPHSGYPHPGDLDYWLHYDSSAENRSEILHLWEADGELRGWLILYEPNAFDMAVHQDDRGGQLEAAIIAEGIRLQGLRPHAPDVPLKAVAYADETARIALLEQAGFVPAGNFLECFACDLSDDLPAPQLPPGFTFLPAVGPEHVEQRADVHKDAFNSKRMNTAAYHTLRTAPNYDPALDVTVVAEDGTAAAFAMVWVDERTGLGLFEPVGTRKTCQRRGLGRAALLEGMRRMRARGMTVATVLTYAGNTGNIAFYEGVGFRRVNTLRSFTRPIEPNRPVER